MNIYVGNLAREVGEDELRAAFEAFGQVSSVNIIKDKFSGMPRGFAFVEMPDKTTAEAAIRGLHLQQMKGRNLDVTEARPREERRSGGGGGGRHGRRGSYSGGRR